MLVHQIYTFSPLRNFSYLIERENGNAVCVDPFDANQMLDFASSLNLKIEMIINTHEHLDHYCGNAGIVEKTGARVLAHINAKGKIPHVDEYLSLGDCVAVRDGELEVMDTPGHTFAHLCLKYIYQKKVVAIFTGDTLFNAGVGNCHNGGDPAVLYKTISEQFHSLEDHVILYPGHDYIQNNLEFTLDREPSNKCACTWLEKVKSADSTKMNFKVADEREFNTFFRLNNEEIVSRLSGNVESEKEIFLRLRELRNKW
ncbi:hydroxyacylglutathione hydrolase [Halobacteriovorax sp. JY17]|uniref:hydroxyacylglutathione hydrolase n=1 Tax=Halobacteriovorax sp. JY17 TaxID=2014617 RepID=UPI000C542004|nr:hydroxyacylglutathione hydrolase [Halobacteriovorax sp. JY17]PIK16634.1 MAG: hydroxyacylglutathione hydrolase [Halobacteriovorax sp. JY17]